MRIKVSVQKVSDSSEMQRSSATYSGSASIDFQLTLSTSTSGSVDSLSSYELGGPNAHPPRPTGETAAEALRQEPPKDDICSLNIIFCKKCSCRRAYRQYFFRSKAVVIVLILNALFSTALYGVASEILKIIFGQENVLARNLVLHGVSQIMFPVAGHIADMYAGKHNMIRASLWTAFVGFAILGISFSLDNFNESVSAMNKFAALPISFLLLTVAHVCFMSTIIPFGMDQLQSASHEHYRSFFYWWYWTLNVGVVLVNVPQYCRSETEMSVTIQAEIGILCISAALVIDVLLKDWLLIEPRNTTRKNPLSQIVRILAHMTKNPATQRIPSAVRHELERSPFRRLDLAKKRYGGKYETEEVEDVVAFFRILLVLISVGGSILSYAGIVGTVGLQASHMQGSLASVEFQSSICEVGFTITDAINAILLLTIIPLLDLLIVPALRNTFPSILRRLGFGATLACLSLLSLFLIEAIGPHSAGDHVCMFNVVGREARGQLQMSVYWIFVPLLLVTLAEVFIYIPCFEFISAQSPASMRGLLIGLFFSIQGTFSLLATLLEYLFSWSKVYTYPFVGKTGLTCAFWYYLILVCVSVLGFCAYIVTACRYKNRQRDDIFSSVALVEECFQPGPVNGLVGMYYDSQMAFVDSQSSTALLYR